MNSLDELRAGCEKCRLFEGCRSPLMRGVGATNRPALAIVGDAPDRREDRRGSPLEGEAGSMIKSAFRDLGGDLRSVFVTNAVRCHPPGGAKDKHVRACREFLFDELAEVSPKFILALGNRAAFALTGKSGVTGLRGRWLDFVEKDHPLGDVPVFVSYSPFSTFKNPSFLDFLADDLETVWKVVTGEAPLERKKVFKGDYRIVRTSRDADAMIDDLLDGDVIAWDIETQADRIAAKVPGPFDEGARVVCVQFCAHPGRGWLLPVDHEHVEEEIDLSRGEIIELIKIVLENDGFPPLIGQNLKYDSTFLREVLKIHPRVPVFDAYIAHHLLDEEGSQQKANGLKIMAHRYTPLGGYEEEVDRLFPDFYRVLHRVPLDKLKTYAVGDVDVTYRVREALLPKLKAENLLGVLDVELEKQEFLAEMELHGAAVDWDYNEKMKRVFPAQSARIYEALRGYPEIREVEEFFARKKAGKDIDKAAEEIEELRLTIAELAASGEEGVGKVIARKNRMIQHRRDIIEGASRKYAGTVKFNANSVHQLRHLYFDILELPPSDFWITDSGEPSTRKEVVEEWFATIPQGSPARDIIEMIVKDKRSTKIFGTYIRPLVGLRGVDGRVHTRFNQGRVVTWRLSSESPNLQNLPRNDEKLGEDEVGKGDVKRQFIAPYPGWWVAEVDYAQIELRIAGLISQDPVILRCVNERVDLHRLLASRAFSVDREIYELVTAYLMDRGVRAEEVNAVLKEVISKAQRTEAKSINFGYIYGISPQAVASQHPDISLTQARRFIKEADRLYVGFVRWVAKLEKKILTTGFSESLFGHRRHFPAITLADEKSKAAMLRQGVNFPIQCTASNLTIYAGMIANDIFINDGFSTRIFGQVHDSLWVTGPPSERDESLLILKTIMENMDYPWLRGEDSRFPRSVPIEAEVKIGTNLRDMSEILL